VVLTPDGTPHFTIAADAAWDHLTVTEAALRAVREANAVCFGSLAQRSAGNASAIRQLLAAAPDAALKIFDINLRQNFYGQELIGQSLALADVLKLNDQELVVLAKMFTLSGPPRQQVVQLAGRFDLQLIALTRGGNGSLLYQAGAWSERAAQPVGIVDTVGAGDSFTAAVAMGLLNHLRLEHIHQVASDLASYVCACAGATPALPDHFRKELVEQI
jgi:fructokinase